MSKIQIKRQFGIKNPWYALTYSGGTHIHPGSYVTSAPVYIGQTIADKIGMHAEPWEHIMFIGQIHSYTDGRNKRKTDEWASVAAIKYILDTRQITDDKILDLSPDKIDEIFLHAKLARDNHQFLQPSERVELLYKQLEDRAEVLEAKANGRMRVVKMR